MLAPSGGDTSKTKTDVKTTGQSSELILVMLLKEKLIV